jgi:hypothetical protein
MIVQPNATKGAAAVERRAVWFCLLATRYAQRILVETAELGNGSGIQAAVGTLYVVSTYAIRKGFACFAQCCVVHSSRGW